MYNWRLLLLAFFAVFQPIASFTERNLVDGRAQCCEHHLLRDTRFDGTFRLSKPKDRRLNHIVEIHKVRRYEVRESDPVLTLSLDRHVIESRSEREVSRISPEFSTRLTRTEIQRVRTTTERQRDRISSSVARENRNRNTHRISSRDINRDERNRQIDVANNDRDNRKISPSRFSRDNSRFEKFSRNDRQYRLSKDTSKARDTRRNRDSSGELRRIQQSRETRNILQRARDDVTRPEMSREREDRRIVKMRTDERRAFSTRSVSRFNNNRKLRSLDRHDTLAVNEYRRTTSETRSADRVREMRTESRFNSRDVRDERQHITARRIIIKREASRDSRASRESFEQRRLARETSDRTRNDVRYGDQERRVALSINDRRLASEPRSADRDRDVRDESRYNRRIHVSEERQRTRTTARREVERAASWDSRIHRESRVSEERRLARETTDRSRNDVRLQRQSVNDRRLASEFRSADRVRNTKEESRFNRRDVRDERLRINASRNSRIRRESSEERRLARETSGLSRNEVRDVRIDTANRREVGNEERQYRYIRDERKVSETRREQSKIINTRSRDRVVLDREGRRTADRLIHESRRDAKESRRVDMAHQRRASQSRPESRITRHMVRGEFDSRFRFNTEVARSHEFFASVTREKLPEYQSTGLNWQHIFYTLQGIYICGVLIQMMTREGAHKKKSSSLNWWSGHKSSVIKVD